MMAFAIKKSAPEHFPKAKPAKKADWTDRLFDKRPGMLEIPCKECGKTMYIPPSKRKQRSICSRPCAEAFHGKIDLKRVWSERVCDPHPSSLTLACKKCGVLMYLPPSQSRRRFCSMACLSAHREDLRQARMANCETCGKEFERAKEEQRFCSQKCNTAILILTSPEILKKAQQRRREKFASGEAVFPSGPANKHWKGGPKAARARQIASGKAAAYRRKYRKENPDKIKEFATRRKRQKLSSGRLPRGTVTTIRKLQGDRCAICAVRLKKKGHLDHIFPIAKGGMHVPKNLQLLCQPCNSRKSAKDPIDYMQSLGRLL